MKIAVLDGHTENPGDLSWKGLESLGELMAYDRTPEEQVVECIGRVEAVYTNKTSISAQTIKSCPSLRFIGVLATGYNIMDTHAAGEAGAAVFSTPSYGTDTVAQYVIALLLELCHHVGLHADRVKAGRWIRCKGWCFWKYPLIELAGKTMGIIGLGYIGRRTAVIVEVLGMKVPAYDRYQDRNLETDNYRYVDLKELLACSDVVSLHCPPLPETEKIINRQIVAKMKKGVLTINTSRGKLMEEADLREGPDSGKIGGTAVDAVSVEPIQEDNSLSGAKDIPIIPYTVRASGESRQKLMSITVKNLIQFMAGTPQHVVSKP